MKQFFGTILIFLLGGSLWGQSLDPQQEITSTLLITNANVITKPGITLSGHHILIKNGVIVDVAKSITPPADAKIVKADSMFVYSGFIETLSHTGIPKAEEKAQSREERRSNTSDPGNPTPEQAGITPQVVAFDLLNPKEGSISEMRKLGFTISNIIPRGKMLPGFSSIINLKEAPSKNELLIQKQFGQNFQLSSAGRVYPSTVIAVISKFKELYQNASLLDKNMMAYQANPLGKPRPSSTDELAALIPVVKKSVPFFTVSEDIKALSKMQSLQKELGFSNTHVEVKFAYPYMQNLSKQTLLFSIDLPKEIEAPKDTIKFTKERKDLEKKRNDSYAQYLAQYGLFEKNGFTVGFSYLSGKPSDIHPNIRKMVKNGLSEQAALAALTTLPAKILGIEKVAGTIEKGKLGNLVILDKNYFDEKSKIKYVVIEGQLFENKEKEKPKKDKDSKSTEETGTWAGKWTYSVEIMGQTLTGIITINGNEPNYEIVSVADLDPSQESTATDVKASGESLAFQMSSEGPGGTIILNFTFTKKGEQFDGIIKSPYGEFPISGKRIPDQSSNQ